MNEKNAPISIDFNEKVQKTITKKASQRMDRFSSYKETQIVSFFCCLFTIKRKSFSIIVMTLFSIPYIFTNGNMSNLLDFVVSFVNIDSIFEIRNLFVSEIVIGFVMAGVSV